MNSLALLQDRSELPANYLAARNALATCERIDTCQDWANKAAALASYAKQSRDDQLVIMAQRIQARAIRRCGELLKEIPERRGKNTEEVRDTTRTAMAAKAGLTVHQRITATRVASVPKAEFERGIESRSPPTVTVLAIQGRKRGRPRAQAACCPTCGRPL